MLSLQSSMKPVCPGKMLDKVRSAIKKKQDQEVEEKERERGRCREREGGRKVKIESATFK